MTKMRRKRRSKNPIAKDLFSPKYSMKVVPSKKGRKSFKRVKRVDLNSKENHE